MRDPITDPQEGDVLVRDGVTVIVDLVRDGWVYLRRCDPDGGLLGAARVPIDDWRGIAAECEAMVPGEAADA